MCPVARQTLTSKLVAERYRLLREVARGGMGSVWLAKDMKLGRHVAVKVMSQKLVGAEDLEARFEREAMTVAQLRSNHVVQVYDYGVQEGLPFMVMELLEGESLGARLKRLGLLGLRETATIVAQVAKGLKAAHNAGLVHRDLKPSNIFLATHDDAEVVKLLDFGVVKALDDSGSSDVTESGMLLGTPQYMSPEQVRGRKTVDHRSDLWSLAAVMFRMLAGSNPFRGDCVGDVVIKIYSDELPKLTDYCDSLPEEFDAFFDRAFSRKPEDRYQSAEELAQAFWSVCALQITDAMFSSSGINFSGPSYPGPLPSPSDSGYSDSAPSSERYAPAANHLAGATPEPVASAVPAQALDSAPQQELGQFAPGPQAAEYDPVGPALVQPDGSGTHPLAQHGPGAPVDRPYPGAAPAVPYQEPSTPVSTTVGGTQLPSDLPPKLKRTSASPMLWIGTVVVTLLVGGLAAAWWFIGPTGTETSAKRHTADDPNRSGTAGAAGTEDLGAQAQVASDGGPSALDAATDQADAGAEVEQSDASSNDSTDADSSTKKDDESSKPPRRILRPPKKKRPPWF